jgi:hypothetical protein
MESQPRANKRGEWGSFYSNMDIEKTTEKIEKNGGFFSYLWTHLALVLSAAAAVHVMLVVEGEVAALPAPHTRHLRTKRRLNVVKKVQRRLFNGIGGGGTSTIRMKEK